MESNSLVVGVDCSTIGKDNDLVSMVVLRKGRGVTYIVESRVLHRGRTILKSEFRRICKDIQEQYKSPIYIDWKSH